MNKTDKVGIFVYGTLKKNQLRGSLWPKSPISLRPAITLGELWDLGSYPGMHPGSDWVLGELWIFSPNDIEETLRVLDGIEEYDSKEDRGLYLRRQIDVRGVDDHDRLGPIQKAFTYLMPQVTQTHRIRRIEPWKKLQWTAENVEMDALVACWPDPGSFVPRDATEEGS
ncbi:MAG: gamma-glutamylcyclotransferase [Pirellula sp.]|jgi:gamma-glutamylcyclotransferase (GGCT)/AIG2-like uncharacterized protein YtfP|nr:gamma-glutamylcyclotransferase [Pirellula sp.]